MQIESEADVNAKDENGVTPLMIASAVGDMKIANDLILSGADIKARDKEGGTALNYARDENVFRFLKNLESAQSR